MEPTEYERHRKLFEKITYRGPRAYETLIKILQEHFPDAHEILTHVSYRHRTIDDNDNEPSIRDLLNRTGLVNQVTNNAAIINNNHNNSSINNNNNDIHYYALPSTSRSAAPRIQEISNQLRIASIANSRSLPNRKPHIVEFKEQINPELNVQVQCSTKFHGENTSKVSVCKFSSNHLIR